MKIDYFSSHFFTNSFPHIWFISFVYIFGVQVYKKFVKTNSMQKFEDPNVNLVCCIWNFSMCTFSCCGAISTGLLFLSIIQNNIVFSNNNPLIDITSLPEFYIGAQWGILYILSKPFELIDTIFLMLKYKPISTLQWTHHLLTMLYSWYAGVRQNSSNYQFFLLFCFLNFAIHTIMYAYYLLQSLFKLPKCVAKCITFVQISQFIVGLIWVWMWSGKIDNVLLFITVSMYTYYLILFVNFYYRKYYALCSMCRKNISTSRCWKCNNNCCMSCIFENGCTLCVETSQF